MIKHVFLKDLEYEHTDLKSVTTYHYHNNYEIYILLSGDCSMFVNHTSYVVTTGDMLFIKQGFMHRAIYHSENYERSFFNIHNGYLSDELLVAMKPLFDNCLYTPKDTSMIRRLIKLTDTETAKSTPYMQEAVRAHLTELILYCIRNKSISEPHDNISPSVKRLILYINKNFDQPFDIKSAAEMVKMSEGYLSRLFKKETGFTFSEYLTVRRIKHAEVLLRGSQKSISEIASLCGFSSANYFSKVFHDKRGMTPVQFRKKQNSFP